MSSLMLIDGNSLTYRAFYALPEDLATASGQVTNAVFGFTSMLVNLVRDHQPDAIVVAFDRPEPTFRHERTSEYKAQRSKAPDILKQQFGIVREVLEALRIPQLELVGYEADDILATLAEKSAEQKIDTLIVTGDRDSYQLVSDPYVKVVYNKRGVSDYALYDEAGIRERTGVAPVDYVQYAALRGDKSDNLPGVPGVGEKTAAKLINTYGGISGIYDNIDDHSPKLRENLEANEDQVQLNAELMQLLRDVPLDAEFGDLLAMEPYDVAEVEKLFGFLEFNTLFTRLQAAFGAPTAPSGGTLLDVSVTRPQDPAEAVELLTRVSASDDPVALGVRLGGSSSSPELTELSFVTDGSESDVCTLSTALLDAPSVSNALAALVAKPKPGVAVHEAKPLARALLKRGLSLDGLKLDTSLAAYLLDPASASYPLDKLLAENTEFEMPDGVVVPEGQLDFGSDAAMTDEETAVQALAVEHLKTIFEASIDDEGLRALHDDIEIPLVGVLARMEHVGIGVDRKELQALNDKMVAEVSSLTQQIHEQAGEEFNVNSTKVLRQILFEKLELTPQKKGKTGYSTDQATLEKLRGDHPIVELLLRYREVEKLRSTYGQSLLASVEPDDRIRANFRQTVARTGRLSSENPNLHNIPVRTELGREFRRAFVPSESRLLLVADYNQIELRCIAHLAEDPGLIEAFSTGQDVHQITAARVFDVAPNDVTFEQRSYAKMVSYGLAYGMEAYGLAQRLGTKTSEAQVILDAYFESFPAVKNYMDVTVSEARNRGYTETLFGRRRQIPELMSDNRNIRLAGERQAMNAGIQGLAADIFKVALVRLDNKIRSEGVDATIVLQVHDEVIVEIESDDKESAAALVAGEMGQAFELSVPLTVNLSFGETWADAKG